MFKKYIGELWVDIRKYEGLYQISNFGRVKSLEKCYVAGNNAIRNNKTFIMKPINSPDGYLKVHLSKNGNSKSYLIHRLVATAFMISCGKTHYFNSGMKAGF